DGIRDWSVTGVQTCALPISSPSSCSDTTSSTKKARWFSGSQSATEGGSRNSWSRSASRRLIGMHQLSRATQNAGGTVRIHATASSLVLHCPYLPERQRQ